MCKERIYWPTDEWRHADPESVGINSGGLAALDAAMVSQFKTINGIVVVRHGHIAYEKYNNNYNENDAHSVASVTKSILSALVGIAIDKGYIDGIGQKVLEFFPEHSPEQKDVVKRHITIEHLLTMTAPFNWQTRGNSFEPIDRLRRQSDWVAYILKIMGTNGQLGRFQYCTPATHLLSAIITRATGLCAREFANQHLFRPLGMKEIPDYPMKTFTMENVFGKNVKGWVKDPQGHSTGGWGITMSPRDMAKFGLLYLREGQWDGIPVVSQSWVQSSVAPNVNQYGFLWWLADIGISSMFLAAGAGGSYIYCLPKLDLIVAIASQNTGRMVDRWPILERHILPMIND